MKTQLTKQDIEKYIKEEPNVSIEWVCPFCGHNKMEFGENSSANTKHYRCRKCHAEWNEIYKLIDVQTAKPPKNKKDDNKSKKES